MGAGPAANFPASMNTAPLVAYLVAGFLVLGILLSGWRCGCSADVRHLSLILLGYLSSLLSYPHLHLQIVSEIEHRRQQD
jgi:hypothetical protein